MHYLSIRDAKWPKYPGIVQRTQYPTMYTLYCLILYTVQYLILCRGQTKYCVSTVPNIVYCALSDIVYRTVADILYCTIPDFVFRIVSDSVCSTLPGIVCSVLSYIVFSSLHDLFYATVAYIVCSTVPDIVHSYS